MGVGNREQKNYISIHEGKILQRTNAPKETSIQRGSYYYDKYDFVEGVIVGLGTRQREYEGVPYLEQYVDLQDGNETMQLQFRVESNYFRAFAKQIKNVDLSKPVVIQPQETVDKEGKKNRNLWLNQNGEGVGFFYKKDDMKDCPEVVAKTTKKGGIEKTEYDNSAQIDFFLNLLNTEIQGQLVTPAAAAMTSQPIDPEFEDQVPDSDGDLPF
jgi:hypothetical protein